MPVRHIPKNHRSVTGFVASTKLGRMAAYESTLERDVLLLCDFHPRVATFEEQPLTVRYTGARGAARRYTPDLLIQFHPRRRRACVPPPLLAEVKYEQEIADKWDEIRPKVDAAAQFARAQGWRFRLVSERGVRGPYLENARFLLPYRAARRYPPDLAHQFLLQRKLAAIGETTPKILLAACFCDSANRVDLVPSLWTLIAYHKVGCDLHQPLDLSSRIWPLDEFIR